LLILSGYKASVQSQADVLSWLVTHRIWYPGYCTPDCLGTVLSSPDQKEPHVLTSSVLRWVLDVSEYDSRCRCSVGTISYPSGEIFSLVDWPSYAAKRIYHGGGLHRNRISQNPRMV